MSQVYFEKFTELIFGIAVLIILFMSNVACFFIYFVSQSIVFFWLYAGSVGLTFIYAWQYSRQFKDFQETLNQGLLFPDNSNSNSKSESLNIEVEDLPLKCALYYRNGSSFQEIARSCNLPQAESAKRKVMEGIDFLLKFYNENNCKEVKT